MIMQENVKMQQIKLSLVLVFILEDINCAKNTAEDCKYRNF